MMISEVWFNFGSVAIPLLFFVSLNRYISILKAFFFVFFVLFYTVDTYIRII